MLTGVNRSGGEPGGGVSVAQVSRVLSSMDGSLYPKMSMAAVSTPSIRPSPAPAPAGMSSLRDIVSA